MLASRTFSLLMSCRQSAVLSPPAPEAGGTEPRVHRAARAPPALGQGAGGQVHWEPLGPAVSPGQAKNTQLVPRTGKVRARMLPLQQPSRALILSGFWPCPPVPDPWQPATHRTEAQSLNVAGETGLALQYL